MGIKFEKSWIGTRSLTINDKIRFFAGTSDHWGIGINYCHYDRSLTVDILHWYIGLEVWNND